MQSVLAPLIGPKKEIHDLEGRVAIVTGGALGIGYVNFTKQHEKNAQTNYQIVK
jgi:hypothetical protein